MDIIWCDDGNGRLTRSGGCIDTIVSIFATAIRMLPPVDFCDTNFCTVIDLYAFPEKLLTVAERDAVRGQAALCQGALRKRANVEQRYCDTVHDHGGKNHKVYDRLDNSSCVCMRSICFQIFDSHGVVKDLCKRMGPFREPRKLTYGPVLSIRLTAPTPMGPNQPVKSACLQLFKAGIHLYVAMTNGNRRRKSTRIASTTRRHAVMCSDESPNKDQGIVAPMYTKMLRLSNISIT